MAAESTQKNTHNVCEQLVCCDEEIQQASDAIDDAYLANELSNKLQHKRSKRKRPNHDNTTTTTEVNDINEKLYKFQHSPYYLRIPASSVAGLCGLHPFQNLPQLLFDYVYQSYLGQVLLQRDAELLGLTLVDAKSYEQETMLNLASAASKETNELVKQVLEVSEGKRKLKSVDEVQSIQEQIKTQAVKAQESGKLSKKQVDSLVEASRGHVSTGFGTCHEDEALDIYEKRVGCTVRERNEALMEWRFQRVSVLSDDDDNTNGGLGVTAVPMGEARRRVWDKLNDALEVNEDGKKGEESDSENKDGMKEKPIEIDLEETVQDDGNNGKTNNDETSEEAEEAKGTAAKSDSSTTAVIGDKPKPFFRIVGAVDGIRDELFLDSPEPPVSTKPNVASASSFNDQNNTRNCTNQRQSTNAQTEYNFSDDEDNQWALRPIVVECKHRMNDAKVPPPIYDQIQTCLYCHMYKVEEADLIQVVRRKGKCEEKENDAAVKSNGDNDENVKSKSKPESKEDINITITRVSLNDPIHNHNHHWTATLLPRIASFVDAVYNVRRDDGKRYRLIMALVRSQQEDSNDAAEKEAWKLLFEECPWLMHCDTSFGKRRRF